MPDGMTWDQTVETYLKYSPASSARFVFAYLYLTGQRASEALETRRSHIQVKEKNGVEYLAVDSVTLKTRSIPRREIAIPMNRRERPMVDSVLKHIEEFALDAKIIQVTRMTLWNWLSPVTVPCVRALDVRHRKLVDIPVRIHPHYLRHTRATHMADYYDFNHLKLMKYFGWTNPAMPNYYVKGGLDYLAGDLRGDKPDLRLSNPISTTETSVQASQDSDDIDCITPVESHNSADSEVIDDEPI
jgi:integrase